ncbi:monovalent cation:proton antiporter-2 (CPA2) family protein [Lysobacter sp.]|uniref:monovalent cation:proton antiporter-2 (CPA2) family protein n=1 Tax=Lysobacter sp. TaxID=72226 RepID=UPI002D67D9B5|nr:monovalent cation:proton antiporter-2 (CPA2) family protein [Lysobacter sp.]HZX75889.1 monovalent cation:proton antiporter-2 (CPA2) family protein [Lysobacter sp.]
MADAGSNDLVRVVALLGAAVVAVPLFRRLGLGSVLGYLAAGLVIGPFGLGWFADPQAILHVAELGVVMFLFVIGLEMRPSHLWGLRRQIFGLGTAQIVACTLALTGVGLMFGYSPTVAFIGAMGFVLTSTAIVMQLLAERGDVALPHGQKIVSVLLFEDLLIVPLLVLVALLAPGATEQGQSRWVSVGIGAAVIVTLLAAGRWLLNPLFRVLATVRAREVMTAAALLVVLGSALLMQLGGLSMAMGAFLAGVLLSESTFRHQLEADVEPFRGLLLGLFFLGVGMALDLSVVAANWQMIVGAVLAMMVAKALCIYVVARALKSGHHEALDRATLMAQGGEFAFVLYSTAAATGVISAQSNANLTAIVVLSMALTPLVTLMVRPLLRKPAEKTDDLDVADGLSGSVLMIGFGRFGQVVSQSLLARGVDVTIIDNDVEMIRSAGTFGFKIYYGDGTRLDVLRASGANTAQVIAVCIDNRVAANRIVELAKSEFTQAKLLVRSYDREHSLQLINAGVDVQIRETFESAMKFGQSALCQLGVPKEEALEIAEEVRRRDAERVQVEVAEGIDAGTRMLIGNVEPKPVTPTPTPFTRPRQAATPLTPETAAAAQGEAG